MEIKRIPDNRKPRPGSRSRCRARVIFEKPVKETEGVAGGLTVGAAARSGGKFRPVSRTENPRFSICRFLLLFFFFYLSFFLME